MAIAHPIARDTYSTAGTANSGGNALCSLHFCGHGMQRRQRRTKKTQWDLMFHAVIVVVVMVTTNIVVIVVIVVIVQAKRIEATAWMLVFATGQVLGTIIRRWRTRLAVLAMILTSTAPLAQCKGFGAVHAGTGVVLISWRG